MKRLLLFACAALLAGAASASSDLRTAGLNYFTDVPLVNQDGKTMRLYSDLIAGKIVVINSFFTTCNGVCPIMNSTMQKIQDAAGDRLGRDVVLLSISVDPSHDTPAKMRAYAKRMSAKRGWYFLSGDTKNVETALAKLGLATETKEGHKAVVIIGNEPKGVWKKAFGLAGSDDVVDLVRQVIAE